MWTYLAFLFSGIVLIVVFVRRWILMNRGATKKRTQENMELQKAAEDDYVEKKKRVSRKEKDKVVELYEQAEKMLKGGREDEAIKVLVQALTIDELNIDVQHKLAMLYMQKQMFGAAAALFKQLGGLTEEAIHYSHLGLALYQQQEFDEAKKAYQKAVSLDDSRPQRFVSLATIYRSLGELQNAVIALNKAVEKDKENLNFLLLLVDILVQKEDYDSAKKTLAEIINLDPENGDAKEYLRKVKAMASAV